MRMVKSISIRDGSDSRLKIRVVQTGLFVLDLTDWAQSLQTREITGVSIVSLLLLVFI